MFDYNINWYRHKGEKENYERMFTISEKFDYESAIRANFVGGNNNFVAKQFSNNSRSNSSNKLSSWNFHQLLKNQSWDPSTCNSNG